VDSRDKCTNNLFCDILGNIVSNVYSKEFRSSDDGLRLGICSVLLLNVVTLLEHSATIQCRHPKEYLHFRHKRNSFLLPVGYCFKLVAL
jgi:hypothetical protein